MDFEVRKASILAWYVEMASQPFAKAAAWHSVNDLATRFPAVFGDLPDLLVAEMKKRTEEQK